MSLFIAHRRTNLGLFVTRTKNQDEKLTVSCLL